jgi:hypothetical protein
MLAARSRKMIQSQGEESARNTWADTWDRRVQVRRKKRAVQAAEQRAQKK